MLLHFASTTISATYPCLHPGHFCRMAMEPHVFDSRPAGSVARDRPVQLSTGMRVPTRRQPLHSILTMQHKGLCLQTWLQALLRWLSPLLPCGLPRGRPPGTPVCLVPSPLLSWSTCHADRQHSKLLVLQRHNLPSSCIIACLPTTESP